MIVARTAQPMLFDIARADPVGAARVEAAYTGRFSWLAYEPPPKGEAPVLDAVPSPADPGGDEIGCAA